METRETGITCLNIADVKEREEKYKEALDFYQNHPLHVKAATEVVKPAATSRIVVDYEM